jgi:hypothetical protein
VTRSTGGLPNGSGALRREFHTIMRGRVMAFMAGAEAELEIIGRCRGEDGDDRYQIAMMREMAGFAFEDRARRDRRLRQAYLSPGAPALGQHRRACRHRALRSRREPATGR